MFPEIKTIEARVSTIQRLRPASTSRRQAFTRSCFQPTAQSSLSLPEAACRPVCSAMTIVDAPKNAGSFNCLDSNEGSR
jgi:hypothetical protein